MNDEKEFFTVDENNCCEKFLFLCRKRKVFNRKTSWNMGRAVLPYMRIRHMKSGISVECNKFLNWNGGIVLMGDKSIKHTAAQIRINFVKQQRSFFFLDHTVAYKGCGKTCFCQMIGGSKLRLFHFDLRFKTCAFEKLDGPLIKIVSRS